MNFLQQAQIETLSDFLYEELGARRSSFLDRPGAEYDRLRSFLQDLGLSPPALSSFESGPGSRSTNVTRTQEWLRSYLQDLNYRKTAGRFFSAGLESIILKLLADEHLRDRMAPLFEKLLDSFGLAVSWNRNEAKYEIVPLGVSNERDRAEQQKLENLLYDVVNLDTSVKEAAQDLFKDGHYAAAVFEACKVLENRVKERLVEIDPSCANQYGKNLMVRALDTSKPGLRINTLTDVSESEEHEGLRFLLMGTFLAIRNPLGHKRMQHDPYEALQYLGLVSLLVRTVNAATLVRVGHS